MKGAPGPKNYIIKKSGYPFNPLKSKVVQKWPLITRVVKSHESSLHPIVLYKPSYKISRKKLKQAELGVPHSRI